jgi:predicted cupin superfamily sugar epimerase
MSLTPDQLITGLRLDPHPEGGWHRELHRADGWVQRSGDGARRAALTVIAFLLSTGERSRWHRLWQSEEVLNHGGGAPFELHRLPPEGGEAQRLDLGPLLQPGSPQQPPAAGDLELGR